MRIHSRSRAGRRRRERLVAIPRGACGPHGPVTALLVLAGLALAGCQTTVNPATGRREVLLMTEEDERQLDEEQGTQIEAQVGVVQDRGLAEYVASVGERLVPCSPRQNVEYRFQIVEMEEPNAFALPGGRIFVSRGLLAFANDEAELANVLAHEIGHVAARHAAQRHAHQSTFGLSTLMGTLATGRGSDGKEDIGTGGVFAYSRNQEREADRIGQEIAICAGVDPQGMARFLRTLDRSVRLSQGYSPEQHYLSSHPATPERIAEASTRSEIERLSHESNVGAPQPRGHAGKGLPIARTRAEFLRRIEGMSIGRPASEGVFVDTVFVHPELDFTVRFPAGWTVENQNAAVVGISRQHDALAVLELQGEGQDPREAARDYEKDRNVRLREGVPLRIGELPAYRARGSVETPFGPANAEITWIVHGRYVYRLTAGTPGGRIARYGTLRNFPRSFRPLTAEERAAITELRLRIAPALAGESLAALSERTGNEWDVTLTAVANAFPVDRALPAGVLVKVAVREAYHPPESAGADASDPAPGPGAGLERPGSEAAHAPAAD